MLAHDLKLTKPVPPLPTIKSAVPYVFRWRHREWHEDDGSVTYSYYECGPITPEPGATLVETPVYKVAPPTFYGMISVESYLVDLDPYPYSSRFNYDEKTEDDPGVPIGRGETGGVNFLAYPTGISRATRTLTWPADKLRIWAWVKQDDGSWQWHEVSGGSFVLVEEQSSTISVAARDETALPPGQQVQLKLEGHDIAGTGIGDDSVTVFVPKVVET